MKRILLPGAALIALTLASQPSFAADMPVRVVKAPPPVVAPIFDWTGFYVGVAGGAVWSRTPAFEFIDTDVTIAGSIHDTAAIAGATAGANWQFDRWVAGVEGDISWTNIDGHGGPGPFPFTALSGRTEIDWFGTLRARLGYTIAPQWLLYATGGLAVAGIENHLLHSAGIEASASKTKFGWTAGAGIEGIIAPHWTAKMEYLYARFGSTPTGCTPTSAPVNCDPEVVAPSQRLHVVRIGLNYRFATGKAPGPVMTKY